MKKFSKKEPIWQTKGHTHLIWPTMLEKAKATKIILCEFVTSKDRQLLVNYSKTAKSLCYEFTYTQYDLYETGYKKHK